MTKRNKIIYWVSTLWLALGMVSTALVQLFNGKEGAGGADSIVHLGYPLYLLGMLGVLKILGTIAVLVPKFPLAKEWAYAGFFFMMTGALFSHFMAGDPGKEFFGPGLLLVLTLVSWYFRPAERKMAIIHS
jgi:hypothetical protein